MFVFAMRYIRKKYHISRVNYGFQIIYYPVVYAISTNLLGMFGIVQTDYLPIYLVIKIILLCHGD